MVKEAAIPSDLTEALTRMRDVRTAEIDPVNMPAQGVIVDAGTGTTEMTRPAVASGGAVMNGRPAEDEFLDGMALLDEVGREPDADPEETPARAVYRDYLRELPPNWSSRIVECRNDEQPESDDDFVDIGGPDMNGVRHSVRVDTHEVLFLWTTGAELFVFDAHDLTLHGEDIESGYTSWEVTPTDFRKFLGGATRYPDRGARSKRMFWRRR